MGVERRNWSPSLGAGLLQNISLNAELCSSGGAENAGLENRLESDELRLKQPQTSSTTDVSELSQNFVGPLLYIKRGKQTLNKQQLKPCKVHIN